MPVTVSDDMASARPDIAARLRTDVYRALAREKGYPSVTSLARLHDLSRQALYDLLNGAAVPGLATAMRMAADLGVAVEVIWERVG